MVLAGGWAAYMSRPASTWPVSMSATIQACAGPSGTGTAPTGSMVGSASAEAEVSPTVAAMTSAKTPRTGE